MELMPNVLRSFIYDETIMAPLDIFKSIFSMGYAIFIETNLSEWLSLMAFS